MKLLFERSTPGRRSTLLPACTTPPAPLPGAFRREAPPALPELAEIDVERHYTALAGQTYGVNDGFYPLGSCTMKYNPSLNEELAALPALRISIPYSRRTASRGAWRRCMRRPLCWSGSRAWRPCPCSPPQARTGNIPACC